MTPRVKSSSWSSFSNFSFSSGSSSRSNSPALSQRSHPMSSNAPVASNEKEKFLGCFLRGCGNRVDSGHVPRRRIIAPEGFSTSLNNGVRLLWADKHRPTSLSAFLCHTQQALYLKQLISQGNCPHLLLQGPPGAGKKALVVAMLHEIFGEMRAISDNRPFPVQGAPTPKINVPINTSKYHVDINMSSVGSYDKDVLPTIIKELNLSTERVLNSPVVSQTEFGYKVLVIHNAEKLSSDAQLILRRLMDRYGDTCKLILCCNLRDSLDEGLRSRCQVIDVEAPIYEEITEVLNNIAKKEDINLPRVLATRIAYHCKQNLRQAIISLEACKAYQYPFTNDQPVQIGYWEEDIVQIAADMVHEPTPKKLFDTRAKMQSLILDCVPPVLILQKLLEELLLRIDMQLKKLICQWASFYETRMSSGPNAIYQLEAFLAKFMSIYKSHLNLRPRQQFMVENGYSSPKSHLL
ncbi:hypothetical protein Mapa_010296 [Marchantia paleacea]|nr:hypothetical protein Mapa_010296 [Marchantia paleacea]